MPLLDSYEILRLIPFSSIINWSVSKLSTVLDNSKYPTIMLSKVLKRSKEAVEVVDDTLYKRITVRLYGLGVRQRDEAMGKDIGTKRQFIARAGQLIISRIDARNGAVGIVPEELDGAIVTNDFWLFYVVDAVPQYIMLVLSSVLFQKHWQTKSSGTTNRQRVDEHDFLSSVIPLPATAIQHTLLDKYNSTYSEISCIDNQILKIHTDITSYLMGILNLSAVVVPNSTSKLRTVHYKNLHNRWEWNSLEEAINRSLENSVFPIKSLKEATSFVNRGWNRSKAETNEVMYIEIGGIDAEENIAHAKRIRVSHAPSRATQEVKNGDLIIGTTRPYLKRFALIRESENGFVCSSGFQVIEKKPTYDSRYIIEILKIEPTIRQFESLMTGALYPAVNANQLMQIRIPIPPIEIQKEIADNIDRRKKRIIELKHQADNLRQFAKKQFEEAVFGVATS